MIARRENSPSYWIPKRCARVCGCVVFIGELIRSIGTWSETRWEAVSARDYIYIRYFCTASRIFLGLSCGIVEAEMFIVGVAVS